MVHIIVFMLAVEIRLEVNRSLITLYHGQMEQQVHSHWIWIQKQDQDQYQVLLHIQLRFI